MPEAANPLKAEATLAMGAEVVRTGRDFDVARLAAEEHAERHGLRYIHSSNEPLLVAGVATAALELLEAVPEIDVVFVPVGGGSGVLGAGVVARAVNPAIRVVGVQAEGAPAVYRSWREGRRVVTEDVATFAEGLATREPFEMPLALFPKLVDEIVLVDDDAIAEAIRFILDTAPGCRGRRRRGRRRRHGPPRGTGGEDRRPDLERGQHHDRPIDKMPLEPEALGIAASARIPYGGRPPLRPLPRAFRRLEACPDHGGSRCGLPHRQPGPSSPGPIGGQPIPDSDRSAGAVVGTKCPEA